MDRIIEVLDENKSFKLSSDFIDNMVRTCQERMGNAVREVLKTSEFKIGDKIEFSYIIDFERDHVGCEVERSQSKTEVPIRIQSN